ncbi:MAG: hypothetical protein ABJF10_23815 [Chthoniobacter sp.]|uniref:hypothetical protein n=1 Tax=Chthoniobacter sp. TaxID=2510640 RepID=UPI0032A62BE4
MPVRSKPPLQVGTPCPKHWAELDGDDPRRFCGHCQLHVYNLSAMSARERERFVAESTSGACIAYELRPDGSMVTPSRWAWLFRPVYRFQFAALAFLAALLPVLFSGCATRRPLLGGAAPACNAPSQAGQTGPENQFVVGTQTPKPESAKHP